MRPLPTGRWALLPRDATPLSDADDALAWCRRLLARWGVLLREVCMKERCAPPWRVLVSSLRRMEARGEIRGGRFIAGFTGEQFALPHAVDVLRRVKRREEEAARVTIAAADPLNLVGIITPGPRISQLSGTKITYERGVPVNSASQDNVAAAAT
jgi:ATP-dependent Lhr-like helicase